MAGFKPLLSDATALPTETQPLPMEAHCIMKQKLTPHSVSVSAKSAQNVDRSIKLVYTHPKFQINADFHT